MINFTSISIYDKPKIDEFFLSVNYQNCDFSFANLFCWQKEYQTQFAIIDDFLVIRYICDDGLPCYMMPIGNADMREVLLKLLEISNAANERFRIHAVTVEMFHMINTALPNTFSFIPYRDYFEYIYLSKDLIELKGKKYQSKRNHINRFKSLYPNFTYKTLTSEYRSQCKELYALWVEAYNKKYPNGLMLGEEYAVHAALNNFDALGLKGGAIFLNEKMIAFSVGQGVTSDTFVVNIEKALVDYKGAFQLINKLFICHEASEYTFINREEDLGIPSLRQAKMSYYPVKFLERGTVCLK